MAFPAAGTAASLKMKLCLAGDSTVGKTSLIRRFVSDTYDDHYGMTLGAKVSTRKYRLEDPRSPGSAVEVSATIWDIMGNLGFRDLLKDAYFHGAHGVLLVCDGTRPATLPDLEGWWNAIRSIAGPVPAVLLVNKSDLTAEQTLPAEEVERFTATNGWPWLRTSAKTGENVAAAFQRIAQLHIGRTR